MPNFGRQAIKLGRSKETASQQVSPKGAGEQEELLRPQGSDSCDMRGCHAGTIHLT